MGTTSQCSFILHTTTKAKKIIHFGRLNVNAERLGIAVTPYAVGSYKNLFN